VNTKSIVIDASVALKWRLHDEDGKVEAEQILSDFVDGKLRLNAPTLFDFEIANALRVAVNRNRMSEQSALAALVDFLEYEIVRFDFLSFANRAFQLSGQYQRSVYDSAYMALAQSQGIWFFTGDKRLFNSVGNVCPFVQWLGDYRFDKLPY
jgi:predicted nucleic acid-binding protein